MMDKVLCQAFHYDIGVLPELSDSFSVQRQSDHGFAAVACDQTIEQTVNRDSKTKGGIVGFSLNRSSVHRWLLAQSERAAITRKCKEMAGVDTVPRFFNIFFFIAKARYLKLA